MLSKLPLVVLSCYILLSSSLFLGGAFLYENIIRDSLTENMAKTYLKTLSELQNFYASEIVPRVVGLGGELTVDTQGDLTNIPFPATFTNNFGQHLKLTEQNLNVRLYSNHPFSNQKDRILDPFSLQAIEYFEQAKGPSYSVKERVDGKQVMRMATPVFMTESCVSCHNRAEFKFKNVWKVGDFRGVREVTIPVPGHFFNAKVYILGAAFALGSILSGFLVVWPVVAKLNRTLQALKSTTAALSHSNNHDSLTGLPIVNLCRANLDKEILRCIAENGQCALMFIDLDGFKQVNDIYGHDVGDNVLKMAALRIRNVMRNNDTPARVGGDEFAVMLADINTKDTMSIAARINESLAKEYNVDSQTIDSISASIGIAIFPLHGSTPDTLFKQADIAMYEIKNSGKNSYALSVS
ncbi:MAG: diguanylate cyclase [Oceanospirillaceae bacterium]|nr:diguanylate cyclase [Oceanospirillaceae bacterium]